MADKSDAAKLSQQPAGPPKDTIIVAEDSAPNRTILVHLLRKLDFSVIECVDGESAWAQLESSKVPIVAILSDVMMPKLDGVELLRRVRGHEKHKSMPFVLITAIAEKEYIVQAKALNVNGYILKPVTFQRVTSKLSELFPTKKFPKLAG
jgi:two-component system chemotaxis response regulator CheY